MEYLSVILPALLAALAGYLLAKAQGGGAASKLDAQRHAFQELNAAHMAQERELTLTKAQLDEHREQTQRLTAENKALIAKSEAQARELELLHTRAQEDEAKRRAGFAEQMRLMEEQMKNMTQELLKQREQELAGTNTRQMGAIIEPLKETIKEMKTAMDTTRDTSNRNTASLEKAIEEVMKRTTEIGAGADRLAGALRNENKMQGNWGEMVLSELLSSQGLKEGIHYEVQAPLRTVDGRTVLNDESGKRMIPDVVLHYPDGKDAIIDAKVSLTAFIDFHNADTEAEREVAKERHLRSLRQHVKELARKDYAAHVRPPRQAVNYVIMFVPNEGALQLALCSDTTLWREAFEQGVFIAGEQNLIAALRMIELAWTQVQQARNQEEVFELANQLLKRMGDFFKLFEEVGGKIEQASQAFLSAQKKLHTGQQSIVGSANKLIRLGAKPDPKKPIPEIDTLLSEG